MINEAICRGDVNASVDLLKPTNILNGPPLTDIDDLDAETKPDPAVVFHAPASPNATAPVQTQFDVTAEQPATTSAETSANTSAESANAQIPNEMVTLADLNPQAQLATQALISGKHILEATDIAGVSYSTLHHWMRADEVFRQVLRTCRREQTERLQTRLLNMGEKAIRVLQFAVKKQRNVRIAFAILRGLGIVT